MGGLGSTIMTGMAFGAGSEIAHQAVRGVMGGGGHGQAPAQGQDQGQQQQQMAPADYQGQQQQQFAQGEQAQQQENQCQGFNMNFVNCLKQASNDISMCQEYMNMLQQCERDQAMSKQNFN